ncbi:MAG: hypothetical protein Q4E33_04435 [Erysipelotrichaceae bacterium]|nr:hypothetical protein [Erysipelotrichaceae bacterium]
MEKKKLDKRLVTILVLLVIIIIELIILMFLRARGTIISNGTSDKTVSQNQCDIEMVNINPQDDEGIDEYTELVGYGQVSISKDYPYLYLQNPQDNEVYLSFDVTYNDEVLYSSDLIEPGKMEKFDIYSCLDAGKHTLIYSISSYDLDTKETYWSGIKQEQEILIK